MENVKTVISFSQFEEDVVVLNALKGIDYKSIFFIDVGANDAVWSSVTFLMYLLGARGINIEPQLSYKEKYDRLRSEDINLFIGIGNEAGEMEMRGEGQAATLDKNGKYAKGNARIVQIDTLTNICQKYVGDNKDIHFLKIDVEGFEKQVLEGMDFDRFRPWIICLEAYEPGSDKETYTEWEDLLTGKKYKFACERGVNRYYCCEEKPEVYEELRKSGALEGYSILKMGDYEGIINSRWYKASSPIAAFLGKIKRFFLRK